MGQKIFRSGQISFGGSDADRERLQKLFSKYESRIIRRLRGKFRVIAQRCYDVDDILSSARRRVDSQASKRGIAARSESELVALMMKVVANVAVDRMRRAPREKPLLRRQVDFGRRTGPQRVITRQLVEELDAILSQVSPEERAVLELWARGCDHATIANILGLTYEQHRSRWRRLWPRVRAIARESAGA